MPDVLLLVALLSIALALWTYSRAFRAHNLIETLYPGFNERMRGTCATLRRWGLKK